MHMYRHPPMTISYSFIHPFLILQDPSHKKVRVASFQRGTVDACVELMEATGIKSWATISPAHVTRRVGLGVCKPYSAIWKHLQVKKGDLLLLKGPDSLLRVWNHSSGIIDPPSQTAADVL